MKTCNVETGRDSTNNGDHPSTVERLKYVKITSINQENPLTFKSLVSFCFNNVYVFVEEVLIFENLYLIKVKSSHEKRNPSKQMIKLNSKKVACERELLAKVSKTKQSQK